MAKRSRQTAAKAGGSSKMSPAEWKYRAFLALWTTYLHLRAWGLPEYEQLDSEDRKYFRGLIAKGRDALFAHVEDCKRAVLRGGLGDQVPDGWINLIGLNGFDLQKGFSDTRRDHLGAIMHEMYPLLLRLHPEATPPARLAGTAAPDDLVTTEIAVEQFFVSEATIRRKIKAGELRDYRPAGAPKNAKLLLSRAELSRLFARKK